MAKGSPFTTFTGKLGQIVGFIIKSAASKQVQGMRAYQPNVSNPKTVLQANQRLCLKPLNNMYRALSPIIDRGFEGVRYGSGSRREFLSINMGSFNGPYVRKGYDDPVPGPVQISRGSLIPVGILRTQTYAGGSLSVTDCYCAGSIPATWGELSAALIQRNSDIQDGDQLTFCQVLSFVDGFMYRIKSVVIDSTSTAALTAVESFTGAKSYDGIVFGASLETPGVSGTYCLGYYIGDDFATIGAAGVVQSREGLKGEHLRSDCSLWISPGVYDVWFSQEQYEAALSSYMGDQAIIDWPVQQTAESAVILQESVSVHVPVTALNSSTADHFPNGVDCLGFVMSDGTVGVWVETSAMYLLGMNGTRISWTVSDETVYAGLMSTGSFQWKYYFGGVVSA